MAALVLEKPAAVEPVSLAQAKNFLKLPVNVTNDDLLVTMLIQAAREYVERCTGRSLINKQYRQSLDSFPYFVDTVMSQQAYPPSYYSLPRYSTSLWNYSQMMKLLRSPLVEIISISYSNSATGQIGYLYPALYAWEALTVYTIGDQIEDPNGNLQTVSATPGPANEDGTYSSGNATPTWANVAGNPTNDGGLVWTCGGPIPDGPTGDFIYDSDSTPPRIFPLAGQTWPPSLYVPNAVQLHFVAGYGNSGASCPQGLLMVILQLIWHWYYNREPVTVGSVGNVPNHMQALIMHWRVPDISPTRG